MKFHVEVAAGCHSNAVAPVISRHRTWGAAIRKAIKSDRLVAVGSSGERFQIPKQNDPKLGLGRYGNGITISKARALGLL